MRYFLIAVMFILSLILPGTLFHYWSWMGNKPDFLMLLTIYIAMHHSLRTGVIWGLGAGLFQDLYLGRYIGMYTFTLAIVAFLSCWFTKHWFKDNYILTTFMVFLVTAVGQILIAFLSLGAGLQCSFGDIVRLVMGVSVYNAVLVPITYPLIHRSFLSGWLRYRPRYER